MQWNHTTYSLWSLDSVPLSDASKVHSYGSVSLHSLPLTAEYCTVWREHVLSVHSSAAGQVGSFHFLTVANHAAVVFSFAFYFTEIP